MIFLPLHHHRDRGRAVERLVAVPLREAADDVGLPEAPVPGRPLVGLGAAQGGMPRRVHPPLGVELLPDRDVARVVPLRHGDDPRRSPRHLLPVARDIERRDRLAGSLGEAYHGPVVLPVLARVDHLAARPRLAVDIPRGADGGDDVADDARRVLVVARIAGARHVAEGADDGSKQERCRHLPPERRPDRAREARSQRGAGREAAARQDHRRKEWKRHLGPLI